MGVCCGIQTPYSACFLDCFIPCEGRESHPQCLHASGGGCLHASVPLGFHVLGTLGNEGEGGKP